MGVKANVGLRAHVSAGKVAALNGSRSGSTNTGGSGTPSWRWVQIKGPTRALTAPTTATPSYTVPADLATPATCAWQCYYTDATGVESTNPAVQFVDEIQVDTTQPPGTGVYASTSALTAETTRAQTAESANADAIAGKAAATVSSATVVRYKIDASGGVTLYAADGVTPL